MLKQKIVGLERLRNKIAKMKGAVPLTNREMLDRIATRHIERMRQGMRDSPATGRTYSRPGGRTHTASAASGKAYPRIDTGRLARSLRKYSNATSVTVRTRNPYARKLEYGDLSQNLMPRPFFFRSYRSATRKVGKELRLLYRSKI